MERRIFKWLLFTAAYSQRGNIQARELPNMGILNLITGSNTSNTFYACHVMCFLNSHVQSATSTVSQVMSRADLRESEQRQEMQ